MDEPTNYLDRDSLGALDGAIRKYPIALGGVGRLHREGEVPTDEKIDTDASKGPDMVMGSLGNEIKVKKEKVLTAREKKKLEKKKAARGAQGLPSDSDDDDM